ncbi:putative acyl--CoA ligase YhfT [Tritonibacter multivorans]|uniref:Putative acyl--CoA ligase YhfT n=1 Tax=Tritonibacter multivorans TaxID=928856 RepID=A0A0P1GB04_9RHOB|nr:AMP-binding protein [Tritonibacter multivorans]MDA7422032.1 AMP-binding protein [Tritonibacter multivorans]CUH78623.1 putative acyl--CoA ligase YhfT [Tritonibacter multivorans]SFD67086.1 long-chain acyl-CoA synthetase [Tritonibacter multivorans]
MTRLEESFQTAPTARLLTPDAAGAALLWNAVQNGASLRSSAISATPLQALPGDPQRVFCESSGSSGAPKLIRRSPASWRASFDINKAQFGIGPDDAYAVLGHLGHSLSFYAALEAVHIGAGLALLAGLGPKGQAAAMRAHGITTIYATPSQLRLITRVEPAAFPAVQRIFFGGGKMDPTLRVLLAERFPTAQLMEFFGASETSFVTLSDDQTPEGSVGRAYPNVKLRIGDSEALGDTGEIWVKSPYLFDGYEEGESPLTVWQDGFLSIGEMGRLDAQGYLYLQGRKSRMVTVADQNVFPEAIETVLVAQPGVVATAVITPNDPVRGAQIVAAVVGDVDASALRKACRAELGEAAVPRIIWPLPDLPMLPAGKPDLQHLETLWQERNT